MTEDRREATSDDAAAHRLFQTSTLSALLDGAYEGEMTIDEVLTHGDLGLGTLAGLDGELVVLDGRALVGRADGSVSPVPGDSRTPFAVVTPFTPGPAIALGALDHDDMLAALDEAAPAPVSALRLDGTFRRLRLRAVRRQFPPYRPLTEVVDDQGEWEAGAVDATLVGFRFPSEAAGLDAPGWHLHALTRDGRTGGHVLVADLTSGTASMDAAAEVHLEIPAGVSLDPADARTRAIIADIERRPRGD